MAGSTTWAASKSAYGNVDNFQHNFIMSALEGTGEFAGKSEAYRAGAASYSMHFAVPALMAIASIETSGATANWDLAYAYFHGSTPAASPSSVNNCAHFGTCIADGVTATAYFNVMRALIDGQTASDPTAVETERSNFHTHMGVLLMQAAITTAHLADGGSAMDQGKALALFRLLAPYPGASDTSAAVFNNLLRGGVGSHYCMMNTTVHNIAAAPPGNFPTAALGSYVPTSASCTNAAANMVTALANAAAAGYNQYGINSNSPPPPPSPPVVVAVVVADPPSSSSDEGASPSPVAPPAAVIDSTSQGQTAEAAELGTGALAGIIIAAIVVLAAVVGGIAFVCTRKSKGKPIFTCLEPSAGPKGVVVTKPDAGVTKSDDKI